MPKGTKKRRRISEKRKDGFLKGHNNDLKLNKHGIFVSRLRSMNASNLEWTRSVREARHNLGVTGFVPVGGNSKNGTALLAEAQRLYREKI